MCIRTTQILKTTQSIRSHLNCLDIDECSIVNGGCQDVCTNTDGGFFCNCSDGGKLQPDGVSCKAGKTMHAHFLQTKSEECTH